MAKQKTKTTVTAVDTPHLSPEQSVQVLELVEGVDSVELKLSIPVTAQRTTIAGLPLDPVETEPRQVFFFDTPDLALNRAGVVVRARRIRGGTADTVVKLRPVDPKDLPENLRRSAAFKVELDVLPGGFVCSASLRGRSTGEEVNDVADGKIALSRILTKEQRAFYREHAPEGVELDALVLLGPTFLLKSQFYVKKLDRKFVAELWLYPDGTRILELSTKCSPANAFQVAAEFRAYLGRKGAEISPLQETKTKTALDYFSAELQARSPA
jgi:hypothetical protein